MLILRVGTIQQSQQMFFNIQCPIWPTDTSKQWMLYLVAVAEISEWHIFDSTLTEQLIGTTNRPFHSPFSPKRIAGLWSMSYDKRLRTLGLQSLEYRRVINDLILYYKIKNGLLDTDISNNFIAADNLNTRGHSCKLIKQHCTICLLYTSPSPRD